MLEAYERCLALMAERGSRPSRALLGLDFLARLKRETPGWRFCLDSLLDAILPLLEELTRESPSAGVPPVTDPEWYDRILGILPALREATGLRRPEMARTLEGLRRQRLRLRLFGRDERALTELLGPDQLPQLRARGVLAADGDWLEAALQACRQWGWAPAAGELEQVAAIEKDWDQAVLGRVTCPLVERVPLGEGEVLLGVLSTLRGARIEREAADGDFLWHNTVLQDVRGEGELQGTTRDAMAAAWAWLQAVGQSASASPRPGLALSFSDKTVLYAGSSLGLAVGLLAASRWAEARDARRVPALPAGWALTGGVELDGTACAARSTSLAAKLRAVQHSPCRRLIVGRGTDLGRLSGIRIADFEDPRPAASEGSFSILRAPSLGALLAAVPRIRARGKGRLRRRAAVAIPAAVALVVALVLALLWVGTPAVEQADLVIEHRDSHHTVIVRGSGNHVYWRHRFPVPVDITLLGAFPPLTKLALFVGSEDRPAPGRLWVFDLERSRWPRPLGKRVGRLCLEYSVNPSSVVFPREHYQPGDFDIGWTGLVDVDNDSLPEFLFSCNQVSRSPSFVTYLEADGTMGPVYANYGNLKIEHVGDLDGNGRIEILGQAITDDPYPQGLLLFVLDPIYWANKFAAGRQTARWSLYIPKMVPSDVICQMHYYSASFMGLTEVDGQRMISLGLGFGGSMVDAYVLELSPELEILALRASTWMPSLMQGLLQEGHITRDYSSPEFLAEWRSQCVRVPRGGRLIQR